MPAARPSEAVFSALTASSSNIAAGSLHLVSGLPLAQK